jgi:hypothetical protein
MNPNPNNVTQITDKQQQPVCRFTIQATLRGFPITIEGEGRAGDLKLIVERLLQSGAEPPAAAVQTSTQTAQGSTPVCPEHGTAKPSKKPGSFYCPKSLPDGGYCRWVGKA